MAEKIQVNIEAIDNASGDLRAIQNELDKMKRECDELAKVEKQNIQDEKNLAKARKDASATADDVTRALLGQVAGYLSLAGVIAGVVEITKAEISAAADSETNMVRLTGTLVSMGRGGEEAADGIAKTAAELAKISTFEDDDIIRAYTAIAKFDSIDAGGMDRLIKTALNVTAVIGGDLASNAENIARILETGLVPKTYAFDAALREQVKSAVEAGKSGRALELVLGELEKRYGGQAAAELDTFNGKLKILQNNWGEFLEQAGSAKLSGGKGGLDVANTLVTSLTQLDYIGQKLAQHGGGAKWWEYLIPGAGSISAGIRNMRAYGDVLRDNRVEAELQSMRTGKLIEEQTQSWSTADFTLRQLNPTVAALAEHMQAVRGATEEEQKAMEKATKAMWDAYDAMEKVAKAAVDMRVGFEEGFTAAEKGPDRVKAGMDLMESMLKGLGSEGSQIWEGFLMATGEISPAAIRQFVMIQDAFNKVKQMLASGMSVEVTVQYLTSAMGQINNSATQSLMPDASEGWKYMGTKNGKGTGGAWFNEKRGEWHFGPAGGNDLTWKTGTPGWMTVPSGHPNDDFSVGLSSGEKYAVIPANGQSPAGGGMGEQYVDIYGPVTLVIANEQTQGDLLSIR